VYYVQAGAYSNADDAEQQRARLAIQGIVSKVTEREQAGRTVYRVRLGPFNARDDADRQTERLKSAGAESTVVRVDKPKP
jgi:cell division protein FtsN